MSEQRYSKSIRGLSVFIGNVPNNGFEIRPAPAAGKLL
jgi:hypothetical protein